MNLTCPSRPTWAGRLLLSELRRCLAWKNGSSSLQTQISTEQGRQLLACTATMHMQLLQDELHHKRIIPSFGEVDWKQWHWHCGCHFSHVYNSHGHMMTQRWTPLLSPNNFLNSTTTMHVAAEELTCRLSRRGLGQQLKGQSHPWKSNLFSKVVTVSSKTWQMCKRQQTTMSSIELPTIFFCF